MPQCGAPVVSIHIRSIIRCQTAAIYSVYQSTKNLIHFQACYHILPIQIMVCIVQKNMRIYYKYVKSLKNFNSDGVSENVGVGIHHTCIL